MKISILILSQTITLLLLHYLLTKQKNNYLLFIIKIIVLSLLFTNFNNILLIYLVLIITDYLLLKDHDAFNFLFVTTFNMFIVIFTCITYIFDNPYLSIISSLISFGLTCLCLKKGKSFYNNCLYQQYRSLLIVNFLLLGLLYFNNNYLFQGHTANIMMIAIVIIAVIIECLIIQIYHNLNNNYQLNKLNQSYQITKQYLNDLKTMQYQIENYQHDFTKHLMIINQMIDQDLDKTKTYLNQLTNQAKSIKPVINSRNQNLNLILNFTISKHPELNFEITTSLTKEIDFDYPLCSLLLNLIDKAIVETKKCHQTTIKIKIVSKIRILLITIDHPISNDYIIDDQFINKIISLYDGKFFSYQTTSNINYEIILNL